MNLEIEIKLQIPRDLLSRLVVLEGVPEKPIEQIYLTEELVAPFRETFGIASDAAFDEYRIRRKADTCTFTAKTWKGELGMQRDEYEITIAADLYKKLKALAAGSGAFHALTKIRRSVEVDLNGETVLLEVDDYRTTAGREVEPDFVICEVEVPRPELADALRKGHFSCEALEPLKQARDVTGRKEFSNHYLAEFGL
ncbi:MAG: CYTH domain-containing protein [Verrucomicrobiota bacterium]